MEVAFYGGLMEVALYGGFMEVALYGGFMEVVLYGRLRDSIKCPPLLEIPAIFNAFGLLSLLLYFCFIYLFFLGCTGRFVEN